MSRQAAVYGHLPLALREPARSSPAACGRRSRRGPLDDQRPRPSGEMPRGRPLPGALLAEAGHERSRHAASRPASHRAAGATCAPTTATAPSVSSPAVAAAFHARGHVFVDRAAVGCRGAWKSLLPGFEVFTRMKIPAFRSAATFTNGSTESRPRSGVHGQGVGGQGQESQPSA